jgi:ribosomal protein L12E/L44/L45/RPP1/RPP2
MLLADTNNIKEVLLFPAMKPVEAGEEHVGGAHLVPAAAAAAAAADAAAAAPAAREGKKKEEKKEEKHHASTAGSYGGPTSDEWATGKLGRPAGDLKVVDVPSYLS